MDDKAIRYISLAAKAGKITIGTEDCNKAVRKGVHGLIVVASDAAQNTRRNAVMMSQHNQIRVFESKYTKWQLSIAVGRQKDVAMILINDDGLANAIMKTADVTMEQEEEI